MNELTIERLTASAVSDGEEQAALDTRLRGLLHRVAMSRLDTAMSEVSVPRGHWCIRRLDLALTLDFDRADTALETQWSRALADAIAAGIASRSPDVVHYPRMLDAVVDLLVSATQHCGDRDWAWRQIGLLTATDRGIRSGSADPADVVLGVLRRRPREAVAAVRACARTVGAAPLHRILGSSGWSELGRIAVTALGDSAPHAIDVLAPRDVSDAPSAARFARADDRSSDCSANVTGGLVRDVLGRSLLAAALGRLPIRVDPSTARAWAVIAAADAAPAILLRTDADLVIRAMAEHFRTDLTSESRGFLSSDQRSGLGLSTTSTGRQSNSPPVDEIRSDAPGVLAQDPSEAERADRAGSADRAGDAEQTADTLWAGLLFLLNTAAQAGIPEVLLEDPRLNGRPLWRTLSEVLQRTVPISAGDPALLAICGLPRLEGSDALTDEEQAQIDAAAARWAEVTVERMGAFDEDPQDVCVHVALRRGAIAAERGWIEVHLSLDDVDLDVRRAGLDLDPGWVPWLGSVVRFRYD